MGRAPPLALLALLLTPASLHAHGGQYQRPAHLGPMTGVAPGDSGRFGAGTTPGSPGSLPSLALPLRRGAPGVADSTFTAWWRIRGPALLWRRTRMAPAATESGSVPGSGRATAPRSGRLTDHGRSVAARWDPIRTILGDALTQADPELVDSALIARGRITPREDGEAAFLEIWPLVAHPIESIRRSAVLALGLLESDRSPPVLLSFLHSTGRSDSLTNSIAAIALGLQSEPRSIAGLCRVADSHPDLELRAAAVLGLGLFGEDRRTIVTFLLERLQDRGLAELVRVQIPVALARLGDEAGGAVAGLRAVAQEPRAGMGVRRSAVLALGRLASAADEDTVTLLLRLGRNSRDGALRGWSWIALGRIAGRGPRSATGTEVDAPAATEARARIVRELTTTLAVAGRRRDAAWGVMALGLALEQPAGQTTDQDEAVVALLRILERNRTAEPRAAAAIALGLAGVRDAVAKLERILQDDPEPILGQCTAIALGLLGDPNSLPLLVDRTGPDTPMDLREAAATGLHLGSPEAAGALFRRLLEQSTTLTESVFVARTAGAVGDASCLPPLVRLARNPEADPLSRAFAVVGLGRLLEQASPPWNVRLFRDSNYLSPCGAERILSDIY